MSYIMKCEMTGEAVNNAGGDWTVIQSDKKEYLHLILPEKDPVHGDHAVVTLSVGAPFAGGGTGFPAIAFAIRHWTSPSDHEDIASGAVSYSDKAPASTSRKPITLVGVVKLPEQTTTYIEKVSAVWMPVRGATAAINGCITTLTLQTGFLKQ